MQDPQVPTDPEDEGSDLPRRPALRLRDTEAVATARRDMFGDGSLLDSLAGSQPAPKDPESQTRAAEPYPPEAAGAEDRQEATQQADPAAPGSFAEVAQSLDAIIDSFPVVPPARGPQRPSEATAEASLGPSSPDVSPAVGFEADTAGPSPDAASAIAASQMGISSLFDSLGGVGQRVDDAQPSEEPPTPRAPTPDLDMSMLEVGPTARPALLPESDLPAAASLTSTPPASTYPDSQAHEIQAERAQADVVQAEGAEGDEAQGGGLDLDMSMLERPPARPVLQSGSDPYESYGDRSPSDGHGDPHHSAQDGGEPPFADVEPRQAVDPPPLIEPLVMPGFGEPSEPEGAPRYAEPMAGPAFGGLSEPVNDHGLPEPLVVPADPEEAGHAERPMFDAEFKIAAEAQATADALDNLKRLLENGSRRLQEPIRPPGQSHVRLNLHGDPAPFQLDGPATLIPMPMPMPEPPERGRLSGIYLIGFLTGLGLSLMAGIALYVLINMV